MSMETEEPGFWDALEAPKPADTLWAALAELQTSLPRIAKPKTAVVKTKTGGEYKYKYENLGQISFEILPMLGKLGLSWVTMPTLNEQRQFVLSYRLVHVSGDSINGEYPLPSNGTPQEMGSAITYARRYCLCAVTGVAPDDDDDDGAAASKARQPRQRAAQTAPRTPEAEPEDDRITSAQIRSMQTLFGHLGIADRGDKLKYAVEVVDRPLGSSTELTRAEASRVIDKLRRWESQDQPPAEDGA